MEYCGCSEEEVNLGLLPLQRITIDLLGNYPGIITIRLNILRINLVYR